MRPRSVGVEHAALAALSWLGMPDILEGVGFNAINRNCALGSIIGRFDALTSCIYNSYF